MNDPYDLRFSAFILNCTLRRTAYRAVLHHLQNCTICRTALSAELRPWNLEYGILTQIQLIESKCLVPWPTLVVSHTQLQIDVTVSHAMHIF